MLLQNLPRICDTACLMPLCPHQKCIATHYKIDVFSEQYWEYVQNFLQTAFEHGMNMVLTPLFTPPLDTKVGAERPTVQLVGVKVTNAEFLE